jgi:hypothetical protein
MKCSTLLLSADILRTNRDPDNNAAVSCFPGPRHGVPCIHVFLTFDLEANINSIVS